MVLEVFPAFCALPEINYQTPWNCSLLASNCLIRQVLKTPMSNTSGIFPCWRRLGFIPVPTAVLRTFQLSPAAWAPGQVRPMYSGAAALMSLDLGRLFFPPRFFFFFFNTFYNVRSQQGKRGLNKYNYRSNAKTYTLRNWKPEGYSNWRKPASSFVYERKPRN